MYRCVIHWLVIAMIAASAAATAPPWDEDDRDWDRDRFDFDDLILELPQDEESDAIDLSSAGLLREGSRLLHAPGRVRLDEKRSAWVLRVTSEDEASAMNELTLMPNAFLSELLQVLDVSTRRGRVGESNESNETPPTEHILFEVSGQVFLYQRRNYLLLTHPPRVLGHDAPRVAEPDVKADAPAEPQTTTPGSESRGTSAQNLMRDLEQAAGPRPSVPPRPAAQPSRINQPDVAMTMREGSMVMMRRGRVVREGGRGGGAWTFLFDADATGLADPPLTLLPCRLLERIEYYAQRAGNTTPVLLSGRVYVFEGRGYLLPTVFQLPRERTTLLP